MAFVHYASGGVGDPARLLAMDQRPSLHLPLELLCIHADHKPDALALSVGDEELTLSQLWQRGRDRAGYFHEQGVGPGERVALYTDDALELWVSMYALWMLGASCVPINISQREVLIRDAERCIRPNWGFHGEDYLPRGDRSFPMRPMAVDGRTLRIPIDLAPDDLALILSSPGMSGEPKAVPVTHRALAHSAWESAARLSIRADDRILIRTPPYYASAIAHLLTMISQGGSLVVDRSPLSGGGIVDALEASGSTGFGGVPIEFIRLSSCLEQKASPPGLRFVMCSGDYCPGPVWDAIEQHWPSVEQYAAYDLTEVAGRLCILEPGLGRDKRGSVGRPLAAMTISIRDDEGIPVGPGESGQIVVSGVSLMRGYVAGSEEDDALMTEDGLITGDIGYLDDDDCLHVQGRRDDILEAGDQRLTLNQVDDVLVGIPGIDDFVASFRLDRHGRALWIRYTVAPGGTVSEDELRRHLLEQLPSAGVSVALDQIPEIPRATSGRAVRRRYGTVAE